MQLKTEQKPINLIFITGFLGSGKTTLLNNILNSVPEVNKGVIVNEFGEINVDGEIIEHDKKTEIKEISNGSIFCSCLSGSFIKSILEYENLPLDYLFVETSGLSNPSSIHNILDEIETQAPGKFNFRGMIAVVDAVNFLTIVQSAQTVQEQVMYSDTIIINKIDKVEKETVRMTLDKIKEYNQQANILKTTFGEVGNEIIKRDYLQHLKINPDKNNIANGSKGNISEVKLLNLPDNIDKKELKDLVEYISEDIYRMKGFINCKQGPVNVDGVERDITFKNISQLNKPQGIVLFIKNDKKLREKLDKIDIEERINVA